jgi:hypothetical protein
MQAATGSAGRLRWWLEGEPTPLARALVADPDAVLTGPGSVARARVGRKRFFRVERAGAGPALYVKVFALPTLGARLSYLGRPSKARREAAVARALVARGIEVAAPLAVGEERRAGLLLRSFSAIAERPGRDLRTLLSDPALARGERRRVVLAFADFARRLHDAGVDQDDFSPNNFLVEPSGGFCLLDLERCRAGSPLSAARRWTLLAKLHRHRLGVSSTDRLRFLARYLGAQSDRAARRAAWLAIRAEFLRIRRRDARRAARAAFRVGRHVGREDGVWFVRGREHVPVSRLELGRRESRRTWIAAHQLERLGTDAPRPVRLGPGWIELEARGATPPAATDVARALRDPSALGRKRAKRARSEA